MPSFDGPCFTLCSQSTPIIQELLDVAKQDIPCDFWKATPLVLKATAGLRLLPGEKAQNLLQKVILSISCLGVAYSNGKCSIFSHV